MIFYKKFQYGGTAPTFMPGARNAIARSLIAGSSMGLIQRNKLKQKQLNARGAALKLDGVWGPKSQRATMGFQKANGLKVDGIFGQRTQKTIDPSLY